VIDEDGYRANVAIVLVNKQNKVFWGKRIRQRSWQFPQGGIQTGETALAAMYRELFEEVGLRPHDVDIIAVTRGWLRYRLPEQFIRSGAPLCIGQKQKWFFLRMLSPDTAVKLDTNIKPEFDHWCWVDYWHPLKNVIPFKKHVYRRALEQFHRFLHPQRRQRRNKHHAFKHKGQQR